jgi:PQQ-like domain
MSDQRRVSGMTFVTALVAVLVAFAMAVPATAGSLTQTWAQRYAGGNDFNYASSLAVAPDGKTVFVTGISAGPAHEGEPYDAFATIAYNTATGDVRWLDRFSPAQVDNWASTVVVAPDGQRVFVTGATPIGYPIVAYDAATGTRLWVRIAPKAGSVGFLGRLTVSPDSQQVFFTGERQVGDGPETGLSTIAFRAATGSTMWSKRFAGSPGFQVRPSAIVVDPQGRRVFVDGATGDLNEFPTDDPPDFVTVAYGALGGRQLWSAWYDGPAGGADEADALAVTPDGRRVIVAGTSGGADGLPDYAVIAYAAGAGAPIWTTRDGRAGTWRALDAITMDPAGTQVVVTGGEADQTTMVQRYRTVALSVATGARNWSAAFTANQAADAHAIAMDPSGSIVYVTGGADSLAHPNYMRYTTVGYGTATGQQVAVARYGPITGPSEAAAIGVAPAGGIFITGRSSGAYATVAYTSG